MSKLEMLTPDNSAIALIDYQPAMFQGVRSHDRLVTINNVQILVKAAKLFKNPDRADHCGRGFVFRTVHSGSHLAVSEARRHRPHVHEFLARCELPKGGGCHRSQEIRAGRSLDRGLRDLSDLGHAEGRL